MLYVFGVGTAKQQAKKEYNFVRKTEASKVSVAFDKISSRFMQETDLETTLQRQMLLSVLLNLPLSYWSKRFLNLLALSFLSLHCLQRDIAFYSHRFFFKFVTSITKESIFARTNTLLVGTLIPKGDDVLQKSGKLTVFIAGIIFIVVQCPCKKYKYRHTL